MVTTINTFLNSPEYYKILFSFFQNQVKFMIVGGVAVNIHGFTRTTSDLDLFVFSSQENINRIAIAFKQIKYSKELIEYAESVDCTKPFCIKIGEKERPNSLDIFNKLIGVDYTEAEKLMLIYTVSDELKVGVIHYTHLVVNKMLVGRPQDKADIDRLQNIKKYDIK